MSENGSFGETQKQVTPRLYFQRGEGYSVSTLHPLSVFGSNSIGWIRRGFSAERVVQQLTAAEATQGKEQGKDAQQIEAT